MGFTEFAFAAFVLSAWNATSLNAHILYKALGNAIFVLLVVRQAFDHGFIKSDCICRDEQPKNSNHQDGPLAPDRHVDELT